MEVAALRSRVKILEYLAGFLFSRLSSRSDENRSYKFQHRKGFAWRMLFLTNEPAKKAEINILTARDTTGPGY